MLCDRPIPTPRKTGPTADFQIPLCPLPLLPRDIERQTLSPRVLLQLRNPFTTIAEPSFPGTFESRCLRHRNISSTSKAKRKGKTGDDCLVGTAGGTQKKKKKKKKKSQAVAKRPAIVKKEKRRKRGGKKKRIQRGNPISLAPKNKRSSLFWKTP